ncbi:hypothetical protein FNH05_36640, partial [Amycolatopsis rhizosphaerae]
MTGWEGLVSAALLGTQRRPAELGALPAAVGKLARGEDPARELLSAAAALTVYRRAGAVPLPAVAPPAPAPADERPLAGPAAVRRLDRLLAGEQGEVLPEWLRAVAARGLRVPPERLPALAGLARSRPSLRDAVAAAAGPRGPWLAALVPEWAFLAGADTGPDVWRLGAPVARRTWLAQRRREDPAAAREALARVWAAEPAARRAEFLAVLVDGLSAADEDFLESALDDRSADVRRLAADLLARLPGSRLAARMAERAAALVTVEGDALRLSLPGECDGPMLRDGVRAEPPLATGRRAWWFRQIVAATPLSLWSAFASGPRELLRRSLARGAAVAEPFRVGLAEAAGRQRDREWARALLAVKPPVPAKAVPELIAVLPPGEWAAALAGLWDRRRGDTLNAAVRGLPA